MVDLPPTVEVELNVAMPDGRRWSAREDAPAHPTVAGADDVAVIALVGRAAKSAVVRFGDGAGPVLDMFDRLRNAITSEPEPAPDGTGSDERVVRYARALDEIRNALKSRGVAVAATPDSIAAAVRFALANRHDIDVERHALARMVNRARAALSDAGIDVDPGGDEQIAGAIRRLQQSRDEHRSVATGRAMAAQNQAVAVSLIGDRDRLAAELGRAAKAINDSGVDLGDEDDEQWPSGAIPVDVAVQLLLERVQRTEAAHEVMRRDMLTARRERDDARREAEQLRAAGEHGSRLAEQLGEILHGSGLPSTIAGMRRLRQQRDNAMAHATGLRRQLDGAERWADLLRALGRRTAGAFPIGIRSKAGGSIVHVNKGGGSGVQLFMHGDDSGVTLGGRDAAEFFLAVVAALYPPAAGNGS